MGKPTQASDRYNIWMDAACTAITYYLRSGELPTDDLTVERDGKFYTVSELEWTYLLPDAIDHLGRRGDLWL